MEYTFIGDVHGYYGRYKKILKQFSKNTIALGDMGIGFVRSDGSYSTNPPYDHMVNGNHRFIRGNHDNPEVCKRHTQFIKDGHTETTANGTKIMFIGGAFSIDREWRIEGQSWWPDEELSYAEFMELSEKYLEFKPDVMVTHDCPCVVSDHLFAGDMRFGKFKTRTGQALESMWLQHNPKTWLFGHWHINRNQYVLGTNFICLGELNTLTLDL